jgi:zinc protease
VLGVATPGVLAQDAAPAPAMRVLSNGMRVVVVESHLAPIVETGMWYRFGSADETPGKTGLAHALEHMMFRGTSHLSYSGLQDFVAHVGGRFNAQTTEDYTRFYFVVPSASLESVMRLEADRMQNLSLDQRDWDLERKAVLNEIDNATTNPTAPFFLDMQKELAHGSGYSLTPLGHREDVVRSTVDDLRAYYEKWYAPNNATFVVVGDVHADAVFEAAQRVFGEIPSRAIPLHADVPLPGADPPKTVVDKAQFPFEIVDIAYAVPGIDAGAVTYAVQNFALLINDELGPFYKNEVQSGLALFGGSEPEFKQRSSFVHVMYVVAPGHSANEVRLAFESTLHDLVAHGPPPELVQRVRARLVAENTYARDSVDQFSEEIGDLYGIQHITIADDTHDTDAVAPEAVRAAASKYFSKPTVIGDLQPLGGAADEVAPPQAMTGGITDNFASRTPEGPQIQPDYIRAEMRRQIGTAQSRVDPVTFKIGGMTVLVQPVRDNPTVVLRGSIRTSPAFDPPGKEGLGSTALALLNYGGGTTDFSAAQSILGRLGASLSIGSEIDGVCYSKDFDAIVPLFAGALTKPDFPQNYLTIALRQASESAARADTLPSYRFERLFEQLLLPKGDPELRVPTPESIGRITREDLVAYAKRYIRPEATTLSIVGDVNPAHVREVLERALGTWRGEGPAVNPALPPIPLPPAGSKAIRSGGSTIVVRLGQPGIARNNPDYYSLAVANEILGHSSNSWLMTEMRWKRGLVYGVSSSIQAGPDRGTIIFDFDASPQNLQAALSILRAQVHKVQNELIDFGEIEGAKKTLVAQTFVRQSSYGDIADDILALGVNGIAANYYQHVADEYRGVTPQSVRAAAEKYYKPDHLVEVYQGPVGP